MVWTEKQFHHYFPLQFWSIRYNSNSFLPNYRAQIYYTEIAWPFGQFGNAICAAQINKILMNNGLIDMRQITGPVLKHCPLLAQSLVTFRTFPHCFVHQHHTYMHTSCILIMQMFYQRRQWRGISVEIRVLSLLCHYAIHVFLWQTRAFHHHNM